VHLRLIIEFLIKPADPRAIRRHDYTSNFHMESALRGRLNDDYEFASRHVAHLNVERVPTDQAPVVEYVDGARLRDHATDAFKAMGAFVQHLEGARSVFAGDFGSWLAQAEDVAKATPGVDTE
jgi:hypothetical protein